MTNKAKTESPYPTPTRDAQIGILARWIIEQAIKQGRVVLVDGVYVSVNKEAASCK